MYKLLQKYKKGMLAFFAVGLMITFLVQMPLKSGRGARSRRAVGSMGKQTVYADDLTTARDEWSLLTGQSRLAQFGTQFVIMRLGRTLGSMIMTNRDLFFLLQREAEQVGIRVSDDTVNTVFANEMFMASTLDLDRQAEMKDAIRHVLEISILRDRVTSGAHVSEPSILRNIQPQWQTVRLNLVTLAASDFKAATTMPTTQQVEDLFDRYKNLTPDSPLRPATDPLGFGYQVPNRVKVQYLVVPHKQIADAARAGKSAYDWEVQARIYYAEHQDEFVRMPPATLPATLPASMPASLPATLPDLASTIPATLPAVAATVPASLPAVASSQPATKPSLRPFAEVKDEILDKLVAPEIDKLATDVTTALKKRLDADWQANKGSLPTTQADAPTMPATQPSVALGPIMQPTTLPATTQAAPFDSYAYLENVALDIQRQFHVLPEVHQLGEWEDSTALAKEPGIGAAHSPDFRKFVQYAAEDVLAFSTATQPAPNLLRPYQPSQMLTDLTNNTYIFRLTAVSPAHAPDFAEVMARVREDTLTNTTYAQARDEARKLLDDAKKLGLSAAAVAAHRSMTSTGNFRLNTPFIPNFIAGQAATAALVGKARALLEEATPEHPHPVALVEMPSERKVVIAELADIFMDADESEVFRDKVLAMSTAQSAQTDALIMKWFDYNTVVSRLNYKLDKGETASKETE